MEGRRRGMNATMFIDDFNDIKEMFLKLPALYVNYMRKSFDPRDREVFFDSYYEIVSGFIDSFYELVDSTIPNLTDELGVISGEFNCLDERYVYLEKKRDILSKAIKNKRTSAIKMREALRKYDNVSVEMVQLKHRLLLVRVNYITSLQKPRSVNNATRVMQESDTNDVVNDQAYTNLCESFRSNLCIHNPNLINR